MGHFRSTLPGIVLTTTHIHRIVRMYGFGKHEGSGEMAGKLVVRRDGNMWICSGDGPPLEAVGFIDLMIRIRKELRLRKFVVTFDSEGSEVDGAVASFDFGDPDTYVPG